MSSQTFPLSAVQELARFREEAAGRMVALAAARLAEGRQKSDALRDYREQYAQQLLSTAENGIDAGRIRDTLAFIARIDQALEQQAMEIARLESNWQSTVADWNERTRELKTYGVLEQRHIDKLAVREQRHAQRLTDEWANRQRDADV